ncbi:hypothetical protein PHYBLDRAFT_146382 [Phycomyces blakesleeanus NRRL 1555(-)]|uniref:Uncharacterized protein n=1 Tax=Phycomyces blakesleeanus (strain ATCC 8743b / DSM 1359 / FGSC 10004 / NBRC 33097 / NRRL 1555) TaxID=763407 RepID=A0A163DS08_PHYB8|nr:hypothetical protein PHYBLDRAFT_146382 [Phycomyces blakesleeanus NRRL 1555(-)]OAD73070.1 hypothetical protein PHYBLDRAFT_146382 [Phycomyces blakesleeanus NRRL 1555(-)]|eukprot:XP_018291110.1 hypothetical protein PHYBLDRAFT_146382 [Phycomyces blakesleeanus NRRL 1555(-)]
MFLVGASGARFPKTPGGPLLSLETRHSVDVNVHESGTTRHSSPPDQTTKGIHRPVSRTRD